MQTAAHCACADTSAERYASAGRFTARTNAGSDFSSQSSESDVREGRTNERSSAGKWPGSGDARRRCLRRSQEQLCAATRAGRARDRSTDEREGDARGDGGLREQQRDRPRETDRASIRRTRRDASDKARSIRCAFGGTADEHPVHVLEAAQPRAETVRNQRKMQGCGQLQQHQPERQQTRQRTRSNAHCERAPDAGRGALGHFAEGRYP